MEPVAEPTRLQSTAGQPLNIGVLTPGSVNNQFYGAIDEVRISSVARSNDWIATEYNNQSNPEGFIEPAPIEAGAGVTLQDLIDITPQNGTLELPENDVIYGLGSGGVYEITEALYIADNKNITIKGLGDGVTIKQTTTNGTQRVMTVGQSGSGTSTVNFENLTFTGGRKNTHGGGLYIYIRAAL
jgi:hypothetical protein